MTCPICAKDADQQYTPFCSRRCADIDLAKWLGEGYAIPSNAAEDMQEAAEALDAIAARERKPH